MRIIEAGDESGDCALSRAGGADDGGAALCVDLKAKVLEDRRSLRVGEVDPFELDCTRRRLAARERAAPVRPC